MYYTYHILQNNKCKSLAPLRNLFKSTIEKKNAILPRLTKGTRTRNKSSGIKTIAYSDGSVGKGKVINGKKKGRWTTYDKNGIITDMGEYNDDIRVGIWVLYVDGIINSTGTLINEKREGNWHVYYQDTGSLYSFGNFKNDMQDEKWRTFDREGIFLKNEYFKDGKPI